MLASDSVSLHTLTISYRKLFVKKYKKQTVVEFLVDKLMTRL